MEIFNLNLSGKNLIEASAGTGKTYSITTLVLRYILEKNVSIKNILIVTFTTAATFELKERIRKFLKLSYNYITDENESELSKDFIDYLKKFKNNKDSIRKLKLSLSELDEASIFTIHGFCYRVLIEHAFESKIDFNPDFLHNETDLLIEAIYDFWRKSILNLPEYFVEFILRKNISINDFYNIAIIYLNKNFVKIKPNCNENNFKEKFSESKIEKKIKKFKKFKTALATEWSKNKEEIINFFLTNNKRIRDSEKYKQLLDDFFSSNEYLQKSRDFHRLFNNTESHKFFNNLKTLLDFGKEIEEELLHILNCLKSYFLNTLNKRMEFIKLKKRVIGYNDLILKLYRTLVLEKNIKLKEILSKKYYVAFIDEFQDTDIFQYEIFKKIFSNRDIFFIGDPKQSIYSFRGADIHTYIRAKREVKNIYSLKKSYRFSADYLDCVNSIFSKKKSFYIKDIKYENIKCESFKYKFKNGQPFTIKYLKEDYLENKKLKSIEKITSIIIKDIANEIVNLIENDCYLESKEGKNLKIEGSHIAILVRTNQEAEIIKNYFTKLNIPSIIYSGTSVFKTIECMDIFYILNAVLHPANISYIKSALLTDIFNIDFNEVNSINFDEAIADFYRNSFKNYQEIFYKDGIYNMFQEIFRKFNTKSKLLLRPDGERKITNYYHIIELCNNALHKEINGLEELLKWLKEKISSDTTLSEEYEIRLDTDESAVKIITVHRCKGLEFPIIFVPFFWKELSLNPPYLYEEYFSFNETERDKELAFKEQFSEELRLFYVALTRGMAKCYLYFPSIAGRVGKKARSVYNYLFNVLNHSENKGDFDCLVSLNDEDRIRFLKNIPNAEIITDFYINERSLTLKENGKKHKLIFRRLTIKPKPSYIVTSYTSLITEQLAQFDEFEFFKFKDFSEQIPDDKIFEFPSGFKTGIFYHSLLEEIDFQASPNEIKNKVKEKLIEYGYNPEEWSDIIFKNLIQLLNKKLVNNIQLKNIPYEKTLRELEFYFYDNRSKILQCIEKIFKIDKKNDFVEKLKDIKMKNIDAFFNGYIDLVFEHNGKFYIVDYKTNNLGKTYEDYSLANLKNEIIKEYYFVQMAIYLIALVRFLKSKNIKNIYEKIGGAIYLFVRGVGKKDKGVYFYNPSEKVLDFID